MHFNPCHTRPAQRLHSFDYLSKKCAGRRSSREEARWNCRNRNASSKNQSCELSWHRSSRVSRSKFYQHHHQRFLNLNNLRSRLNRRSRHIACVRASCVQASTRSICIRALIQLTTTSLRPHRKFRDRDACTWVAGWANNVHWSTCGTVGTSAFPVHEGEIFISYSITCHSCHR